MKTGLLTALSLVLLSSALLPATAEPAARPSQSTVTEAPAWVERIDALAAEHLARPGGVGLSVAVARRGEMLLSKGYGRAHAEFDASANADTMFRIGSVTKQFTAALVMRLVEQGKLALDDPLAKHVPEFPLQGRNVRLEHLLAHTSGIKSYTDLGEEWHKLWPLELTHAELLALVEGAPFDFEPGADWLYNNTGYYLLGMVIENVTGKSYAEHLEAELCRPLGLTRTRYDSNRDVIENRAQGYALDGDRLVNDQMFGMSQPGAAGGILSTAGDLVRWQMALTAGGFVSADSFARMSTPTVLPSGDDTGYGFGVALDEWAGLRRVLHGGGIFGFNSMLLWLPDEDLHVAVLSNGEELSSGELADAITYAVLGSDRSDFRDEPIPADLLAKLTGSFVFANVGMEARLFANRGRLMMQGSGQDAFRLMWQGELEFRADFDPEVRAVFADDAKSMELFQGGIVAHGKRR